MDPYTLLNPINADELFRRLNAEINTPYLIKSDNIIYVSDDRLFIENLLVIATDKDKKEVTVEDNWIRYLRKVLNDNNKISVPSYKKDIKEFIKTVDKEKLLQGRKIYVYDDDWSLIKWELDCKNIMFTLKAYELDPKKSGESKEYRRIPVHQ
ncbi:19006_t:CDS:1, partial [Racocetra fulgida]